MNKTLSVTALQHGTVVDHIPAGQVWRIITMLQLVDKKLRATVGLNLYSKRLQLKDLLKIENYSLSHEEANKIMIFAPEATINIIKNFEVAEKILTRLPEQVTDAFICPNALCITRAEPITSHFAIEEEGTLVRLICVYCETSFDRNHAQVKA